MKRFVLYLLILCMCPMFSMAQKVALTGTIKDGSLNDILPGASVVLLQPKDSVQAAGALSNTEGKFTLPSVKAGQYILRVSFVGYATQYKNIVLPKGNKTFNVGEITMVEDAKVMKEAEVVAKLAQVEMKEDTFIYNADAFRLPEGSALEELVRKLPGAEVSDDGTIKINGKSVSKIMVEGKEFFNNDTKMAMKNLPSKMVKKIKSYERKSDYSRVTGIDDGEEETVLDLTVQKGMKEGWVGNFDAAYGTADRYSGKFNVNRFLDHSFLSVIASRNNINDGGGRWGGGGGGITTSTMVGATFAWENGKPDYSAGLLKMGGNVRYSNSKSESASRTNSETFLPDGTSTFSNSRSNGLSHNSNVDANFQFEWFPDSMTNIMFRPNFSHSNGDNFSHSLSASFNKSPFEAGMVSPLDEYKTFADPDSIRVNANERYSTSDSKNNNVNGELQINRRLFIPGRNLTLNVNGSYSESESNSYSRSLVKYYQRNSSTATYQNTGSPSKNYSYQGRLSYTEPIFKGASLQFSYQAQYRFQDSNREMLVYDDLAKALSDRGLTDVSATDLYYGTYNGMDFSHYGIDLTQLVRDAQNSQYATYREFNQSANAMFRYTNKFENGQELRFNVGVNFQPQRTNMDYQKGAIDTTVIRKIMNWAPRFDVRWKISNTSQLRMRYNGSMSQPSMVNLIEVMDTSNPLNISTGNAGLKSSWTDRFNFDYNNYIVDKQMGWNINGWGNINRRSISNSTIYDATTGVNYSRPMNIDGGWNAGTWMGFNTAIGASKSFNLHWNQNISYSNNVGYISSNIDDEARKFISDGIDMNGLFSYMDGHNLLKKATTKNTGLGENLRFNYRNDLLEIGVNGGMNYQHARNDMQSNGNLDTWSFNYGGNFVINAPWNMQFSSDISEQCRRGYDDKTMNTNELIWNMQISQNFLKSKNATVSVQWYDILNQRSSISRNYGATSRTDTENLKNILSYVMVHFIYRFNLIGNKEARANAGWGGGHGDWGGRGGFGGPGGGGHGGRF